MSAHPSRHPAVCYVVPHYSRDETQHFAHLRRFLGELGKMADVYVIVEKGQPCNDFQNVQAVYWQRYGVANRIFRSVELVFLAVRAWRSGCRRFFIRISIPATLILSLLGRVLRFEVFYWFSGQPTNIIPSGNGLKNRWKRLRSWLGLVPLTLALHFAHRVVTGPERMVDYISTEFRVKKRKIVVVYNDVDPRSYTRLEDKGALRKQLGLPLHRPIVLFVGRVSLSKGGYNLVPIISQTVRKVKDALFIIIGPVWIHDFSSNIASLGLEENVLILGSVPNTQIASWYACSDVFILPSELEGFPRVLLEAMASGLPVVSFDVGGVRDIVGERQQAFVVARRDYDAFVGRLIELLENEALRKEQGTISRQRVEKFATPLVARMFFERIIEEGASSSI